MYVHIFVAEIKSFRKAFNELVSTQFSDYVAVDSFMTRWFAIREVTFQKINEYNTYERETIYFLATPTRVSPCMLHCFHVLLENTFF